MRYVAFLLGGIVIGWVSRAAIHKDPPQARAEPQTRAFVPHLAPAPPEPPPLPPAPALPVKEEMVPAEEEGTPPAAADPDEDRLRELVHTQRKQWKAFAGMQARQKAELLLASLPFDAETEKRIKELLQQEAELQAERAAAMMLGDEELDPAAFQWFMGIGPELTPGLEKELATFLDDAGIAVVRAEVKRTHEKQMNDMADMQIGMMSIRDLSDDQKTRMREVFVGKDVMTEQFTRFGEIVRDRERFRRLMKGEGIKEEMQKGFQGTRQRVRDILNDDQFAKYELYEQQMVRQAEMGLKMMSSLLGTPREGTKAPASR
ncbi:MAG: hypothetical protein L6Q95_01435 [Planctomycetes bacterium]|nr:hypothetical protein [Planctomycetota bacterium]